MMLSCARKVIESAIAKRVSCEFIFHARQFGFQPSLSAMMTLIDVNALVKESFNKISTLDLTKAYDRVNRLML